MKKSKGILFVVIILNLMPDLSSQTVRKLTIEEMFELADANSRSIRTYDIGEKEAEQAVKVAKNSLLPSIDVSISASYLGDAWISDRNFSHGQNAPMPHFGNNFAIEASQVVYSGGAIPASIVLARLQLQRAGLDKEINKQDIRFLLAGNYLEMYKLKNQEKVYEKNIEQTRTLLEEITAKQAQGLALKNDITRYELQLKSLELALTQLRNTTIILNHQLITVLNLPEDTLIDLDPELPEGIPDLSNEILWQETAETRSPILKQTRMNIEQSLQKEKIARAERLPSVVLFAGDYLDGPITIEVPPINKNLNYWYVGIGVKFNIASTFKTGKNVKLARLSTLKAKEADLLVQEQVRTGIKEAYIRFEEAFTIYETQIKSAELATRNYNIINNRYLNELALLTDMLDASNSKLTAELQVVNARINIIFNYYKLKKAAGAL